MIRARGDGQRLLHGPEASTGIGAPRETTAAFQCYGLRIGISFDDASLTPSVVERLPPGWESISPSDLDRNYRITEFATASGDGLPPGVRLLVGEDELAAWGPSAHHIMDSLESQLQMYVAEFARPHLFVHAGVVAWHGRVIMLPGSSFAGKSTLVTALVNAGATYFSDEYAVLDLDGRVCPYLRRISLREGPFGPARRVDPERNGVAAVGGPVALPVDIVLFATYEQDSEWSCEALGHGAAILALCSHTVAIQRRPADALSILAKVAQRAGVYRAVRGDLDSPLTWIQEVFTKAQTQG